jgi:type I restriction enzyme S subunit
MNYGTPRNWVNSTLGKAAWFVNGYPFGPDQHDGSGLPIVRIEQLKDRKAPVDRSSAKISNQFMLRNGDVIFSWSGSFEVQLWDRGNAWLNQHLFRVIPKNGVENRFLLHFLNWSVGPLSRQSHGTTMSHITRRVLLAYPINLPTPGEQRHIAEILDSVDEKIQTAMRLIAKQKEMRVASIRRLADAGLACFDGIEASEWRRSARRGNGSWSLVPLGSVLAGIDAGHSPDLEDAPAGPGQWGVLKVSAVGEDGFRAEENKVVQDRTLYDLTICVRPGDLLMTRANTSQLVGRSCVVDDAPPGRMLCDKTLRLRVDERCVPTRYVHIVLGLAEVRRQVEIAATGTSGSMKNISQQSIRQLMVPVGSPEDVKRVVEIDELHEAQTSALHHEVEGLRLLKQGLMDDLLTGRVRVPAR